MKVRAIHDNDVLTEGDCLYVVFEDDMPLPDHDVVIDAVDLLPKNHDEHREILYLRTGEIKKNSEGYKEANIRVFHVKNEEEIQLGSSGLYIID